LILAVEVQGYARVASNVVEFRLVRLGEDQNLLSVPQEPDRIRLRGTVGGRRRQPDDLLVPQSLRDAAAEVGRKIDRHVDQLLCHKTYRREPAFHSTTRTADDRLRPRGRSSAAFPMPDLQRHPAPLQ